MDLRKLLQKVETARVGSPELDSEFLSTFRSAPPNVTRSIDAAVRLIETELPGWWWNCGYCERRNGASLYVPGSSRIRANFPGEKMSLEDGSSPAELRLLQDPKWGTLFDGGFHCDRGGTVPGPNFCIAQLRLPQPYTRVTAERRPHPRFPTVPQRAGDRPRHGHGREGHDCRTMSPRALRHRPTAKARSRSRPRERCSPIAFCQTRSRPTSISSASMGRHSTK